LFSDFLNRHRLIKLCIHDATGCTNDTTTGCITVAQPGFGGRGYRESGE